MKERLNKIRHIRPLSYAVFFLAAFIVFLFTTFPGEIIKKRIVSEIESGSPYKAEIEKASISPFLSIELDGVRLYRTKDRVLKIDSLSVRPSILALIMGKKKFPFEARLLNGEIEGSVTMAGSRTKEVKARVKHVTIDSIPALLSSGGSKPVSLGGVMDGTLRVVLEPQAKGEFQFEINGLDMKDIRVKGLSLPSLTGLKSVVKGSIDGKRTNIASLSITGNDIDLEISGTTPLLWEIPKGGLIDLGYRLEMKGAQMAKYKGLLAPYLATQRDGSLGGKILGTIKNPRFEKGSVSRF